MSEFRKRIVDPMLPPIVAMGVIGVLVFSFSRILLAVPEMGSTTLALLISAEILGVCAVLAATSRVRAAQRIVLVVLGLGLIGGGVASAALGVRPIENHGEAITVAAKGVEFTTEELGFPADAKVNLIFNNQDAGIPHNVAIMKDKPPYLFLGEVVTGPVKIAYEIEPLEEGEYTFICTVHPTTMVGKLSVGQEGHGAPHGGSPVTPSEPPASSPVPTGEPVAAEIIAEGTEFNLKEMTFEANAPTTVHFENRDADQHNWALYTEAGGTEIFKGETFVGPGTRDYTFTAPAEGSYYFQCDVHPGMNGTAKVT